MHARSRLRLFALVCAVTIGVGCESAFAAFAVDTSRLPRISGSREIYASPTKTSFITRESVTRAFELTASALINDDWQPYDDPTTARTSDASVRTMSFKKEGRALSLLISTLPAQANATSVSYTEVALRNDLPFPRDATRITFDPERPYLSFVTARSPEATLDYFRNELGRFGWSQWLVRESAENLHRGLSTAASAVSADAYFVRANGTALMLTLARRDDNGLNVELTPMSAARLPVGAPQEQPDDAATVRHANTDSSRPIPVPHASERIDFDSERGTLTFVNPASAAIIAEYYRSTLSPLGWQETATVANDTMMVLRFASGARQLSLTITHTGSRTKVTVEGSGLQVAAALSRSL